MCDEFDSQDDMFEEIYLLFCGVLILIEFCKLCKCLVCEICVVIEIYDMICFGDKWLVCLLGGKDSYILLVVLYELKWCGLLFVDLLVCNLDQGQFGFLVMVLFEFLIDCQVVYCIEYQDIYFIVKEKVFEGWIYCVLCLCLCCGNLYCIVCEEGCQVVVLGYYCDDIFEMFFMNFFYGGCLVLMLFKFLNEEGDLNVLCLLVFIVEVDCERFFCVMNYLVIFCDLCGSQEGLQCVQVKCLLDEWESCVLGCCQVMFWVLMNVCFLYLFDFKLFDFMQFFLLDFSDKL